MHRSLLLGCGSARDKRVNITGREGWGALETLDHYAGHNPDVVWDMDVLPLPFDQDRFDEIHAYECLEHIGRQGDWKFFFAQFTDFWRILKPGGVLCATVPSPHSPWAWGDPSHTRILPPECLIFLSQPQYTAQVGKTAMSDFRGVFRADFDILVSEIQGDSHVFALQAVKPSRITR